MIEIHEGDLLKLDVLLPNTDISSVLYYTVSTAANNRMQLTPVAEDTSAHIDITNIKGNTGDTP